MQSNKSLIAMFIVGFYCANYLPVKAVNIQLQEKLRDAIRNNNVHQVENYSKNKDIDINAKIEGITPLHEALMNLEKYANQLFTIKGHVMNFALAFGAQQFGSVALNATKTAFKPTRELLKEVQDMKSLAKEKFDKAIDGSEDEKYYKELFETFAKRERNIENKPEAYRRGLAIGAIGTCTGFLLLLATIIKRGTTQKKVYNNIEKTKKIIEIITSTPNFAPDKSSLRFINDKLPKYINLITPKKSISQINK